jgi:redox-sensitive bicupin YhaK (pirin superfamily)
MLKVRKAGDRGHANHGWLNSHHTFSFADYYDPKHMGFAALRVINDDTVAPGTGFPSHSHRDMEIISYVLEGALEHKDSMGNGSVIRPGDVQRMSAGPGVVHSEYNASRAAPVHFLQIWLLPERNGLPSGYEQKFFSDDEKRGKLRLVASPDGADGSVRVQQNVRMYATHLEGGSLSYTLGGRKAWLHVARGNAKINDTELAEGDGLAVEAEEALQLSGNGELLLFDFLS